MIGTSHLAFSIILLISSALAIFFSLRIFSEKNPKKNNKPLYFLFSIISFMVSISLIYYTRDMKTMECVYWVNEFINTNKNTFFVSCFNQLYDQFEIMNTFVNTRIIHVHDTLICITVITFAIFIYFTFQFTKVVQISKLKKLKKIKSHNRTPQTENINNNEDQSYSLHENHPFSATTNNNNNSSFINEDPPWVLPPTSDSETPPPQQPWVLPPSDYDDGQSTQSQSNKQPQPQPQRPPQHQIQPNQVDGGDYEYEYEYYEEA